MKTLLTILILFFCINLQAQYEYNKKEAYIGASVLVATFATLEIRGNYMTKGQRDVTATTGMLISAGYMLYKNTDLGKKIQRRIKLKRNR